MKILNLIIGFFDLVFFNIIDAIYPIGELIGRYTGGVFAAIAMFLAVATPLLFLYWMFEEYFDKLSKKYWIIVLMFSASITMVLFQIILNVNKWYAFMYQAFVVAVGYTVSIVIYTAILFLLYKLLVYAFIGKIKLKETKK